MNWKAFWRGFFFMPTPPRSIVAPGIVSMKDDPNTFLPHPMHTAKQGFFDPPNLIEVYGDLLDVPAQYIVHQCNPVSRLTNGLARIINEKFTHADINILHSSTNPPPSAKSTEHLEYPGHIIIRGDGVEKRFVICLMGQFNPGGPAEAGFFDDSVQRSIWFGECLAKIEQIPDLKEIAFPFQIGCGIAGGNWSNYRSMIREFAKRVQPKGVIVAIINPANINKETHVDAERKDDVEFDKDYG